MKTKILLFCLLLVQFAIFQTYTQAPTKAWDKTIGGSSNEQAYSIIQTSDGGFAVAGHSQSTISGDKSEANRGLSDYWIVKLNNTGQKVWDKTFGGSNNDYCVSIISTSDGGFVVAGSSFSTISGDKSEANKAQVDYWVLKLDNTGQKIWDKTFGGGLNGNWGNSIIATNDGGFIVSGYSNCDNTFDKSEPSKGGNDFWILKLNSTGQKVWDKTIGGSSADTPASIIATSDGGFVVAGTSSSNISGDKSEISRGLEDYWMVKINSTGQKVWDKTIGGDGIDIALSITGTSDGGFVIAGRSNSLLGGDKSETRQGSDDYWIVKLNSTGQKVWDKTIGGSLAEQANSIITTSDGGFVVTGTSSSNISGDKSELNKGGQDYWIVKLNSTGQKVWDKTIGGSGNDVPQSIISSSDGGFIVAGYSGSNISGDKSEASKGQDDYWAVKLKEPCPTFTNNIAYVNFAATGSNTGVDWANAFTSLESALVAARTCGVMQIWVAQGTYKPSAYPTVITGSPTLTNRDFTFELVDGVGIYGGFVGTETALTQRVAGNKTILSGDIGTAGVNTDNCYHVILSVAHATACTLDGLTITGGNANGTLIITGVQQFLGGGIYNISSSPNITNVIFSRNSSSTSGGAMFNRYSNAIFTNVVFSANSANSGGSIFNEDSPSVSFKNTVFTDNTAQTFGGAIYNYSSSINLTNAVFSKNNALVSGGGIYNYSSSVLIKNSILSGNQLGGNTTSTGSDIANGGSGVSTSTISYTSMQLPNNTTNYPTANFPNIGTNNNLFAQNPLFVNDTDPDGTDNIFMTADDGLALQTASPCKDAGTATGAPTTDITGAVRVGNVDLGAYEFQGSVPCTTVAGTVGTDASICSGSNSGTLTLTGHTGSILRWESSIDNFVTIVTIANTTTSQNYSNLTQTIKYRAVVQNGTCTSANSSPATITILVPNVPVATGAGIFLGGSVTLTATGCTGSGFALLWFTTVGDVAVTMPVSPIVDTQYYVKCQQTVGATVCASAKSNDVTVTVSPAPIVSVIYVNQANVNPTQDGLTWATAYSNLQSALLAPPSGAQIWVAQGTYKPTTTKTQTIYFNIPNGAMLFGGFVGTEVAQSQRNFKNNPTILSGEIGSISTVSDNSYHVVTFVGANNTTRLDGFTITGGNASLVTDRARAIPSSAILPVSINDGGGIALDNGSSPMIINCRIINNDGIVGGGLFATNGSNPRVMNCVFMGNQATFGGGVYHLGSNPTYNNVLFAGNKAMGGAVYNNGSNPTLTNVTIAGNGGFNGAIFNSASSPTVKNSIIYGNIMPFNDTQSVVTYSIVEGGFTGVGNLNLNPQFVSLTPYGLSPNTSGNYQLTNTSPAIDAGENGAISLIDTDLLDNLRRYNGGIVDMGAYEFQGSRVGGTVISIISGNWESNSTWDVGRSPLAGDNVIINNNHNVTILNLGTAKNVEIRTNAKIIHSTASSKLQMGI